MKRRKLIAIFIILTIGSAFTFSNKMSMVKSQFRQLYADIIDVETLNSKRSSGYTSRSPAGKKGFPDVSLKFDLGTIFIKVKNIEQCYESQSCEYPSNDPREYDLAVGQDIKVQLKGLYEHISKNKIIDKKIVEIADHFSRIPDGHVKEAALMLLGTQPPDDQILRVVVNNTLGYHDSKLVVPSLKILLKFRGNKTYQDKITTSLQEVMRKGSFFVGREVARQMIPLLSENNLASYKSFLSDLPEKSKIKWNLQSSIDEFEMMHSGG